MTDPTTLSLRLKSIETWGAPWGDGLALLQRMKRHEALGLGESYLSRQDVLEKILMCRWTAHLIESDADHPKYYAYNQLHKLLESVNLELFLSSEWLEKFKEESPWKEMDGLRGENKEAVKFFKETFLAGDLEKALCDFEFTHWDTQTHEKKIGFFWNQYVESHEKEISDLLHAQSLRWSSWLEEFPLSPSPLFVNTATLGKALGLTEKQCEYWGWVEVLINQGFSRKSGLNRLLAYTIGEVDYGRVHPFMERFAKCIGADFNDLCWLLSAQSPLIQMGWLKPLNFQNLNQQWPSPKNEEHLWYYLAEDWSNGHDSRGVLYQAYSNPEEILLALVSPMGETTLSLSNWSHLSDVKPMLKALHHASEQKTPCKILLWGPPGTGKTTLATALLKEASFTGITPPLEFKDKNNESALKKLYRIQHMASLLSQGAVLVDECEHLWNKEEKAALVDYLDNAKVSQIWIANDVQRCHPAWLRRFDLVVEIKEMPLETRIQLAKTFFKDANLSHRVAQAILTPAGIVGAGQWCQKSNDISWSNVYRYLSGQQKVLKVIHEERELPVQILHPTLAQLPPLAGYSQLKELQQQWADMQEFPELYKAMSINPPKGIFLSGPPGTGKTLFAQHLAAHMSIPLLAGSSAMMATHPQTIRDVFQEARSKSPCVLFLDEADVLFPIPMAPNGTIDTEKQTILNAMLTELDGTESLSGVLVIAATHHGEDELDPAAFRAGRLSEKVSLSLPQASEREEILTAYLKSRPHDALNFSLLSDATVSMTGADLREVVEKAAILTVRKRQRSITQEILEKAADEVFWGVGHSDAMIHEEDRYRTAIHETGHALIALRHGFQVPRVTIRPRAEALGITQWHEGEGVFGRSKEKNIHVIEMMFGGLAAEKALLNSYQNGGESDLKYAQKAARRMLSSSGHGATGPQSQNLCQLSERSLVALEDEENILQKEAFENALNWLQKHQALVERCAKELLAKKELSGQALVAWRECVQHIEGGVVQRSPHPIPMVISQTHEGRQTLHQGPSSPEGKKKEE